jgi:hypothetical protein
MNNNTNSDSCHVGAEDYEEVIAQVTKQKMLVWLLVIVFPWFPIIHILGGCGCTVWCGVVWCGVLQCGAVERNLV